MKVAAQTWTGAEAGALIVPEQIAPSEWPERFRVMAAGDTDTPGPWRNALAPYLRGLADILFKDGVAAMFVEKASQMGFSEWMRNVIGWLADCQPDPVGLVLPDKAKGRKVISERIIPFFNQCERLRALLPSRKAKIQKEMLRLNNAFLLWLAWAGSPTTTKGDPWKIALIDELDECALSVARLGQTRDLVGAATKRTRTFGDRSRVCAISTPLDAMSEIDAQVNAARFLLEFYVPCPECGAFQVINFDRMHFTPPDPAIQADRRAWAAWVLEDPSRTYYQCAHCPAHWSEVQRAQIIRGGAWATSTRKQDEKIIGAAGVDSAGRPVESDPMGSGAIFDAEKLGAFPRGSTIGVRIWAGYSLLGVTMPGIAAEFIQAHGDRGRMFTFVTETEGRIFEQQLAQVDESVFAGKVKRATIGEGTVPAWAGRLLATVDSQVDHFIAVVRAWGEDHKSQRVWHGRLETFEDLETLLLNGAWPCEDETCGPMTVSMIGIDTGGTTDDDDSSRTMQVYRWAQKHKSRVRPLKGFAGGNRNGQFLWRGRGLLAESNAKVARKRELDLWCLSANHWQSVLQDYIHAGLKKRNDNEAAAEMWLLNSRADERYERELANAQQVLERGVKGRAVRVWKPIRPGGRWDYRDCEVYQCVLASLARVDLLPPAEQIISERQQMWAAHKAAIAEADKASRQIRQPRQEAAAWEATRF